MGYSPVYDVQQYVCIEKKNRSSSTQEETTIKYGAQIKHPCNWLGPIPGINLLSSSYRLATSLIDVISSVYLRATIPFQLHSPEDYIDKASTSDLKLRNGASNFGRSMVELSYIFIMAATLMIKLSRATRHMPITVSHQFLSNFAKQHQWLGLIPLTLFVYDWIMALSYQKKLQNDVSLKKDDPMFCSTEHNFRIMLYRNGELIKEKTIGDPTQKIKEALNKMDISTLNRFLYPMYESNAS